MQGPVPGRGPEVEKHCCRGKSLSTHIIGRWVGPRANSASYSRLHN